MPLLTEPLPIDIFVATVFSENIFHAVMENWRIEPAEVQGMVIAHFKEIGIYAIYPGLEEKTKHAILRFLRNSPDILGAVHKADLVEERKKSSNRHADS